MSKLIDLGTASEETKGYFYTLVQVDAQKDICRIPGQPFPWHRTTNDPKASPTQFHCVPT